MHIIEITPKINKYTIICSNINNNDKFEFLVVPYVNKLMKLNYVIHFVDDIENNNVEAGYHLVKICDNEIHLVEKILINSKGYIWNSQHFEYSISKKFILAEDKSMNFAKPITDIQTFDQNIFGSNNLIIGHRGSGKTTLIIDLVKQNKYDEIIIVSATEKMNKYFSKYFKNCTILHFITEFEFDNIDLDKKTCIVFDDCFSSRSKNLNILENILFNRYKNITTFTSVQFSFLPPKISSNFNNIFMLSANMISNKKKIYHNHCGLYKNFKTFNDIFDQLTRNYQVMVINNNNNNIYTYKAKYYK